MVEPIRCDTASPVSHQPEYVGQKVPFTSWISNS
jgi:hypothetical protein